MDMISPVELGGPQLFSESGSVAVSDPDNSTLHESQMEVKATYVFILCWCKIHYLQCKERQLHHRNIFTLFTK
jgi:hypothetical protein